MDRKWDISLRKHFSFSGDTQSHETIFLIYASNNPKTTEKRISTLKKYVIAMGEQLLKNDNDIVGVVTLSGNQVNGFVTNKKSRVKEAINGLE